MKRADVLQRADLATRQGIRYRLGWGGKRPLADHPGEWSRRDEVFYCDCSGFTAWALGFARQTSDPFYLKINGGWVNTDAMVADAKHPAGIFSLVKRGQARAGDLYVFGKDKSQGRSYGHVGVITRVDKSGRPVRVIHSSPSNEARGETSIAETGPAVFERFGAIVARYTGLED